MFKLFSIFAKNREYQKLFDSALSLSKQGNTEEAFQKFNELLADYPTDVYVRRQILLLGGKLHRDVELPDLTPKTHNNLLN